MPLLHVTASLVPSIHTAKARAQESILMRITSLIAVSRMLRCIPRRRFHVHSIKSITSLDAVPRILRIPILDTVARILRCAIA